MKLFKFINISLLLIFLAQSKTYSAAFNSTLDAATYQITITRIELCATGSSLTTCLNSADLFTGTSDTIDIASATAGASAATLGNPGAILPGTAYTHMQVTMKRSMTIKGGAASGVDGVGGACYTDGTAGTATTSALGSKTSSDLGDTVIYVGVPGLAGQGSNVNSTTLGDGTGTDAATGTFDSGDEFFEWRGALTNAFTMAPGQIPSVEIAFSTTSALGFYNNDKDQSTPADNECDDRANITNKTQLGFYGSAPTVTLTFK